MIFLFLSFLALIQQRQLVDRGEVIFHLPLFLFCFCCGTSFLPTVSFPVGYFMKFCVFFSNSLEMQRTAIEAGNNWWGYNESTAVVGRIRDYRDLAELLQVRFEPFYHNNYTVLSGKCDPGWTQVGDTCYTYIGVPMNFSDAKEFCKKDNASLPYLMSNYYGVMEFLQSQQIGFDYFARAWVQHLDMIGQCVVFVNRRVERSPCDLLLPFLCEAGWFL